MTALALPRPISFPWFRRKAGHSCMPATEHEQCEDLRREYVTNLISSGACAGECGAMALMSVFPKDF